MTTTNPSNLIATVESYLSPSFPIGTPTSNDPSSPALGLIPPPTLTRLKNLGTARVRDMRALGQSRQIISHLPIVATPQTCARANDALYAAICLNGEKFAALALLPTGKGEGKEAARELQRCVTKYRFVGGVVGLRRESGSEGNLNDGSYEELWAVAGRYRVPIIFREMWPMGCEVSLSLRAFSSIRGTGKH